MSDDKARLFAALELPADARAALARWRDEHAPASKLLRHVAAESLHVTLCFLGWRAESDIERIGGLVSGCAGPVGGLSLGEAAWMPARRPRVLAVDLHDPSEGLHALQGRVSGVLEALADYEPEKRPFRAHVTVARVRHGARVRPDAMPAPPPLEFAGAALTLFRSHLERSGARYEALRRVAL